jgi:probable rRNA maturation factor
MEALDTVLEDARWEAADLPGIAERAARATLDHLGHDPEICELTVLGCDDARIATLNADFRSRPTPTNVLSWPHEERAAPRDGGNPHPPEPDLDGALVLGDIAISYDTCAAEAQAAGRPMEAHVTHLVVHGVLHLLGYDHERDADAARMEGLEVEILGKMGLDDPYRAM